VCPPPQRRQLTGTSGCLYHAVSRRSSRAPRLTIWSDMPMLALTAYRRHHACLGLAIFLSQTHDANVVESLVHYEVQ